MAGEQQLAIGPLRVGEVVVRLVADVETRVADQQQEAAGREREKRNAIEVDELEKAVRHLVLAALPVAEDERDLGIERPGADRVDSRCEEPPR